MGISVLGKWRGVESIGGLIFLIREGREVLAEKVTNEQRLEGGEEGSLVGLWRKSIPGRENSKCKGPGAGACLSLKEASGAEWAGGGSEVRKAAGPAHGSPPGPGEVTP